MIPLDESLSTATTDTIAQGDNSNFDSGPSNIKRKSEIGPTQNHDVDEDSLSDVVAALVSSILALTFLLLLFCIIRIIRKRRRQLQGQRLNQPVIQTIGAGAFTASIAAYRQHIPVARGISWERVDRQLRRDTGSVRSYHRNNYDMLRSGLSSLESPDFLFSGPSTSSFLTEPFQDSSELSYPGTSASLAPRTEADQPSLFPHEMFQLSATSAKPSSLQIVKVDAVLHHSPAVESQAASVATASNSSAAGVTFPSLPPPLFGSSYHQWTSFHEHETLDDELCEPTVDQLRPVRTFGHQHRPSQ